MKIKILGLLIFIAALLVCGCNSDETAKIQENINAIREDSGAPPKNFDAEEKLEELAAATVEVDEVEEILKSMTLEEKIGQMMIFGFHGTTANEDINWMLANYHSGGIILFDRNMENKAQVKTLLENLNSVANEKVPLFFAIDEEGGRVARMTQDLTPPPSQKEIGNSGDSSQAYSYANSIAQELKAMGINLNFAPVADVGTPDTRSYSDNGNVVAEFVSQAAKGYEDAGIFYCLKHFPGIGLWQVDSHQDIETITGDRNTFDTVDLVPFKKIISEQDNSHGV